MDLERERRLEDLGFPLDRVPAPAAVYRPVVVVDTLAYVSGAVPFDGPGNLVWCGKVGAERTLEEGQRAAALCAANVLRVLHQELGSLARIRRLVRVGGYVNSSPDFTGQHLVVNGASELFVHVLGEAGQHARTALGLVQLPLGATVEIDAIAEVEPQ
jgi:enamine deaminase RidA (YjgF/YER057c/UK114 family)